MGPSLWLDSLTLWRSWQLHWCFWNIEISALAWWSKWDACDYFSNVCEFYDWAFSRKAVLFIRKAFWDERFIFSKDSDLGCGALECQVPIKWKWIKFVFPGFPRYAHNAQLATEMRGKGCQLWCNIQLGPPLHGAKIPNERFNVSSKTTVSPGGTRMVISWVSHPLQLSSV